eukprot:scaffold110909_cov97-Phaeocystis_antarctica.AAC.1
MGAHASPRRNTPEHAGTRGNTRGTRGEHDGHSSRCVTLPELPCIDAPSTVSFQLTSAIPRLRS